MRSRGRRTVPHSATAARGRTLVASLRATRVSRLSSFQPCNTRAGTRMCCRNAKRSSALSHVTSHRDVRCGARPPSSAIATPGIARYAFLPISACVHAPIIFL
ncbi:hypothetical protein BSLA_01f4760 [Burkholderia stabilis]|nr:hypothetical protein BSLA_01f4760 [Burkholderia stabilis]